RGVLRTRRAAARAWTGGGEFGEAGRPVAAAVWLVTAAEVKPIARTTAAAAAGNAVRRTDMRRITPRRLVTRSDNGSLIVAPSLRQGYERGHRRQSAPGLLTTAKPEAQPPVGSSRKHPGKPAPAPSPL